MTNQQPPLGWDRPPPPPGPAPGWDRPPLPGQPPPPPAGGWGWLPPPGWGPSPPPQQPPPSSGRLVTSIIIGGLLGALAGAFAPFLPAFLAQVFFNADIYGTGAGVWLGLAMLVTIPLGGLLGALWACDAPADTDPGHRSTPASTRTGSSAATDPSRDRPGLAGAAREHPPPAQQPTEAG